MPESATILPLTTPTPAPTPPAREPGRPWTLKAAADFLQVSEKTIRRAVTAGRLRIVKGVGSRLLIVDADLRALASGE